MKRLIMTIWICGSMAVLIGTKESIWANGGPFVIKHPNGDPAAKGVLARLDPDLKPGRETRLRVVKEDLKIAFETEKFLRPQSQPLARVTAEYTIENPTDEAIKVDFGFPILRGVYIRPYTMSPTPDVRVYLSKNPASGPQQTKQKIMPGKETERQPVKCTIISNSAIYGIIRQRAREVIEEGMSQDHKLKKLITSVRSATDSNRSPARNELSAYLTDERGWNERDTALMVEYASLDLGRIKTHARDSRDWWPGDAKLNELVIVNMGPLGAIGEQKATQFFAHLAALFEPEAASTYEGIFSAWGGDVREKSLDLETGKLRPRQLKIDFDSENELHEAGYIDPTIYARVDYLDPHARISESEKASCRAILKNLKVIFTFAPMNILHYQVKFPAQSSQTLTVTYSQYAYADTKEPRSYQVAYVVHPACLWEHFGPINLEVVVPERVTLRASDNTELSAVQTDNQEGDRYVGRLKSKRGELYLALDAAGWKVYALKRLKELPEPGQQISQQLRK